MKISTKMKKWFSDAARVFCREFRMVFRDPGIMIFFFALPLIYPIVYSLIYNPEVTRDMPVAVVDNCRTTSSREFVRHADATEAMKICGYASNLGEAKRWWEEKKCFAVIYIPADYEQRVGRGEQGVVHFYSDVSLLLRYRTFLSSLTELQMATDAELRQEAANMIGLQMDTNSSISAESYFLGDTQQGFASFIIPGIVVLILQQSMLLGITMLGGTSKDRRRRNGGIDPLLVPASASATVVGRALCYVALYIPLAVYVLHYIPLMFAYPHIGKFADFILFIFPLLLASAFLGQALQPLVSERESSFVVIVFTSVVFLFLSGLTWPRYAMNQAWYWLGNLVPATWGVEGFININSTGATLGQEHHQYLWLWGLSALYFILAIWATYHAKHSKLRELC